jgi:membrane protease YdiL (CAAX protease family)
VALELLAKLGIGREKVIEAVREEPPANALVGAAIASAAGLPILLFVMRRAQLPIAVQAAAFVLYGALVPFVVRRFEGREGRPALAKIEPARLALAIGAGLAATAGLVHGTHQFFEAGGELARCTSRLDAESQRALAAEAAELAKRIASVRGSFAMALMTTAVMPLAEERIYRGLLMDVLVKRYGTTYGMFAAAAAFGIALVGVYEIALYQTVLLGIGFGLAYAEGGIIAAFVVHALWNLLNVA